MKQLMHFARIAFSAVHLSVWMGLGFILVIAALAAGLANWPLLTLLGAGLAIAAALLYARSLAARTEQLEIGLPVAEMQTRQEVQSRRLERRRLNARLRQERA